MRKHCFLAGENDSKALAYAQIAHMQEPYFMENTQKILAINSKDIYRKAKNKLL